ncbi:MAG: PEP-CTERM sorting domain-containing protein [Burkholderiales bacterium]|nr:MAG: PEP-CTERM sorting domain-containing protein [Burkholderiales bacterium]
MKLATLALAIGLASPAFAASPAISVDFEKTWNYGESIGNFYAAQGVSFVNVLGLSNGDGLGPLANGDYYGGAPSPLGVAYAQLDGTINTAAYMNVAGGVDGQLNFYFSNPTGASVEIKAYSGLNGTGTLLGSVLLASNGIDYTTWTATSLTFTGTALSFDLTATAAGVALDNISAVPEPSSLALLLGGATLLLARRRRG